MTPELSEGAAWKGEETFPGMGPFEGGGQELGREHYELFQCIKFKLLLEHPHASMK